MDISFDNLRQAEGILDNLNEIKEKVEQRINLQYKAAEEKRKKKQAVWNYEKNNDGTHMLEPVNILLMKLAVVK